MSRENPFLSCIVPAFNESENLQKFIPALAKTLEAENIQFEILVVDDGSKDNSIATLSSMLDKYPLRILELSRNFGKEAALSAGIDHVSDRHLALLIDADFQHPLDAIPTMLSLWKEGYDMVYGIRNRNTESPLKKFLTNIYYKILNFSSDIEIPENAGDFRLLDRKVVTALKALPEKNRYMKGLFAWVGFKSIGIHFSELERENGQTHFNIKALFNLTLAGLTGFSNLPLRLCMGFGALLACCSMSYGIWIIIETLFQGIDVPGWATLIVAISLLGGIQLLFLGIVGEYISRIYTETKGRPQYIIAQEHHHHR
jgi:polyisoprenyl-phosphate glycosyltransferase